MPQGDRIITSNITAGVYWQQPGREFVETVDGWDMGSRSWLTHPNSAIDDDNYPKIGDVDAAYPFMQIYEVDDTQEESGLKLITAQYRGVKRTNSGLATRRHFLRPGVSTQVYSLPALTGGGDSQKRTLIVRVPMPTLTRTYVTTDPAIAAAPFDGVGSPAPVVDWLPPPGSWNISYLPDPDEPLPLNYYYGWMFASRTPEPCCNSIAPKAWLITEEYEWQWAVS